MRSGEYGGCGRHSKDRSWIVATVERAVWGEHCHVATKHLYSDVHIFGLDDRIQVIVEEICIRCTGHSVHPGHVVLQNYPLFIPKESAYPLPQMVVCGIFSFLVRRYGTIPCLLS